jgi:hypothetical protein
VPAKRIQRLLTTHLNLLVAKAFMAGRPELVDRARLQCLNSPTTSLWLLPTAVTSKEGIWMRSPEEFRTACRIRLGIDVCDVATPCIRCVAKRGSAVPRDKKGHHSLCCMVGGERSRLHNELCANLIRDASFGLLHPSAEPHSFGDGDRLDFAFTLPRGGDEVLVDVALTFPLRSAALVDAARAPGGAATSYEAVKRARYSSKLGPHQQLIPLVFDTFGGAGASGRPLLDLIALSFARRFGSRDGRMIFFTRLNTLIVSRSAAIVACQG